MDNAQQIEVLSLGYTRPPIECSKARWFEIFRPYAAKARNHAATLAAHNWDCLLIGGRVFLFQPRFGGDHGHWVNLDGAREDATDEQMAKLYDVGKREPDGSKLRLFAKETQPS